MSNQPQAHVADERAAFDKAIADATLTWRSDCPPEVIAWRAWQAARAAIPAGADVAVAIQMPNTEQVRDLMRKAKIPESQCWIADVLKVEEVIRSVIAAGAPAETPKPLTVQRITDIWNETEKEWFTSVKVALDPADAGNLTVHFVRAIERALAAQPAPAPATDARRIGYWYPEHGQAFISDTAPPGSEPIFAAMLSSNSPREAG